MEGDEAKGERLRTGISEVLDGGQQVIVLFSVLNTSKHAILLMPPQIQLGGKEKSGKLVKHEHWSTAEQMPVADFRLRGRRIGPGERADGVVLFERPPYKRSMETLFLQMAESGAVDKPALAPVGFGVSTVREAANSEQEMASEELLPEKTDSGNWREAFVAAFQVARRQQKPTASRQELGRD